MTFPGGGPGYRQQAGAQPQQTHQQGFQPYQQSPGRGTVASLDVGMLTALGVTLLALVEFFVSFADNAPLGASLQFALIGGLLAALRALPKGPKVLPFAALASVLGALFYIVTTVRVSATGVLIVLLILSILQMLVAVAALLLDYEIVSLPSRPKPYPYGQFQAQQSPYGGAAGGQFQQPTQYGAPVTPTGQQGQAGQPVQSPQQPTQYATQQGQFFPAQQQGSGQQEQSGQ